MAEKRGGFSFCRKGWILREKETILFKPQRQGLWPLPRCMSHLEGGEVSQVIVWRKWGVTLYQDVHLNLEEETQVNVAKKTANS